jgi:ribonuclease HI
LGVVCRDSDGELIAAATWEMSGAEDPTLAEAAALHNAVHFAKECCFRDVLFESDCSRIIDLINKEGNRPRSSVSKMIKGIICNKNDFKSCYPDTEHYALIIFFSLLKN